MPEQDVRQWVRQELEEGREPDEIADQLFREGYEASEARRIVDEAKEDIESDSFKTRQQDGPGVWWLDLSDISTWINGGKLAVYLLCAVFAFHELVSHDGVLRGDAMMLLVSFVGAGSVVIGADIDNVFTPRHMGYRYDTNAPVVISVALLYLLFQVLELTGIRPLQLFMGAF